MEGLMMSTMKMQLLKKKKRKVCLIPKLIFFVLHAITFLKASDGLDCVGFFFKFFT